VQRVAHTPPDFNQHLFHPTNAPAHTLFLTPGVLCGMHEVSKNKDDPIHNVCAALSAVQIACMSSFRKLHCNDSIW
jgi:hypothetical protein